MSNIPNPHDLFLTLLIQKYGQKITDEIPPKVLAEKQRLRKGSLDKIVALYKAIRKLDESITPNTPAQQLQKRNGQKNRKLEQIAAVSQSILEKMSVKPATRQKKKMAPIEKPPDKKSTLEKMAKKIADVYNATPAEPEKQK